MSRASDPISKRRPGATQKARTLRQKETEAEYRLWSEIRNRLMNGHKFTRQVPLGSYVADFVCRDCHLIVELDGWQHAESAHDIARTKWLNANGYSVLRFWNHEVLQERRAVLETILAAVEYSKGAKRSGFIRAVGRMGDNMKLDEFVRQTLLDITNGVVAAQRETQLFIAPGYINGKIIEQAHDVKFEVSVTVAAEGGGGIKILSFGELNAGGKSESTNKLMFEIPIYFNAPTPLNPMHHNNIEMPERENNQ